MVWLVAFTTFVVATGVAMVLGIEFAGDSDPGRSLLVGVISTLIFIALLRGAIKPERGRGLFMFGVVGLLLVIGVVANSWGDRQREAIDERNRQEQVERLKLIFGQ